METPQKIFVAIGTVAVVGLAIFVVFALLGGSTAAAQNPGIASASTSTSIAPAQSTTQPTANSVATGTAASGSYKDGQYTSTQSYYVPHGGSNSITVTLTVANGKISAVTAKDQYSDGESSMYVSGFENEVSADASNQSLSSYSPSRIGGASLTTEAFAQAIDAIKAQATA